MEEQRDKYFHHPVVHRREREAFAWGWRDALADLAAQAEKGEHVELFTYHEAMVYEDMGPRLEGDGPGGEPADYAKFVRAEDYGALVKRLAQVEADRDVCRDDDIDRLEARVATLEAEHDCGAMLRDDGASVWVPRDIYDDECKRYDDSRARVATLEADRDVAVSRLRKLAAAHGTLDGTAARLAATQETSETDGE